MNDREQHAIIVGCGRVGAGLAERLVGEGYSVAVVDQSPRAFRRLGDLEAQTVVGVGFDRSTLVAAGVERATSLAAVTNGDNSNIVVARTAAERFGVPRVLARIYDPRRAGIYERLGISTVASSQLTTELAARRLLPERPAVQWTDPSARIALVQQPVPADAVGRLVGDLERDGIVRIVAVRRLGAGIVPTPDLVLQEGDVVYLATTSDRVDEASTMLAAGEGGNR